MSTCPHCGVAMRPTTAGIAHPVDDTCFLSGTHIGNKLVEKFDRRVASTSVPHYTVDGNRPVFNNFNQGKPVTTDFLNLFVAYFMGATD